MNDDWFPPSPNDVFLTPTQPQREPPEPPNAPKYQQSRRFAITLNNYDNDQREPNEEILNLTDGGIWAREVGEGGTPHIQGYLVTKKKFTINGLRKAVLPWVMHIEICKGNSYQNYTYCTKGGDYYEWGTLPRDGFPPKERKRQSEEFETTLELVKQGKWEDISASHKIRFYHNLKALQVDNSNVPSNLSMQAGVWIVGEAGYGKSHSARHDYGGPIYTKDFTKWWGGYNGQPVVILDDVSPRHADAIQDNLKIWGDIYPFMGETKGGFTGWIRPTTFIVTSQYTIQDVFGMDPRTVEAIARRFRVVRIEHSTNPEHADGSKERPYTVVE